MSQGSGDGRRQTAGAERPSRAAPLRHLFPHGHGQLPRAALRTSIGFIAPDEGELHHRRKKRVLEGPKSLVFFDFKKMNECSFISFGPLEVLLASGAVRVVRQPGTGSNPAGQLRSLVHLNPDHPGFNDRAYRRRRDDIARIALEYEASTAVAQVYYTPGEHGVWRQVQSCLWPLHERSVCTPLLEAGRKLSMDRRCIPQLEDINQQLRRRTGFRMEPVAGLVSPRTFMRYLGRRIFLSTQYIRHHSQPFYTPEPDVVHELVGHAATLVHPGIAEVNRLLGQAADVANDTEMVRVDRVYWYTMEFGVLAENGATKAYGAGLLSSCGELEAYASTATLMDWDLERMAETAFDPTMFQSTLFVAPSFTHMLVDVSRWVRNGDWRD